MIREESSGGEEKNIVKASGFSLPVLHKGLTPRYLQRLPLYGVAFPNPRPPVSRAGLKDIKKGDLFQISSSGFVDFISEV